MGDFQLFPWPVRGAYLGRPEPLPGEDWLPIPSMDGKYLVSNLGRVFHVDGHRFLHPRTGRGEYACRVYPYHQKKCHKLLLGHLVATLFNGQPSRRQVIRHRDGNRDNCAASNLIWVAYSEMAKTAYWKRIDSLDAPPSFDPILFNRVLGINHNHQTR